MNAETFRNWLADHGCSFEQTEQKLGQGAVSIVARREGRRSEIPRAASKMDLREEDVRRIVDELDLPFRELPGPQSRRRDADASFRSGDRNRKEIENAAELMDHRSRTSCD